MKLRITPSMNKLARLVCLVLLTLAFTNLTVIAQIKIPNIFKPKPNQPAQPTKPPSTQPGQPSSTSPGPTGGRRATAAQPSPASRTTGGSYIDDGFTWFEAVSTKDPAVKQTNVYTGWALKSSVRLMGIFPKGSAFKIVVSKAGAPIATTSCEAASFNTADESFIVTDGCWQATSATKELGKFDVEVVAINGGTNAETPVRKYKIEVLKVDRVNTQTGKFSAPDAPRYVISRHAEAPVSILFLRPAHAFGYLLAGDARKTSTRSQIEILFSLSPSKEGKVLALSTVQCSVDGKQLDLGSSSQASLLSPHTERRFEEIYSDRIAPAYKAGPGYKDDMGFSLIRVTLPFVWKDGAGNLTMSEHPGKWECSMLDNGERLRTWRWTVGRDGMLVKHPEQQGNANLYFNSYLIDMDIPAGGSSLDKRLVPVSASEGFFYGQKWKTPEGRAMAAKVPTKGSPLPVPSNRIK